MSKDFLESAYEKDRATSKWIDERYLFNIVGICLFWLFFAYTSGQVTADILQFLGVDSLSRQMISDVMPFAIVAIWLEIALPKMHHRSLLTLISAESAINIKRVAQGFGVWFLMLSIWLGIDLWIEPSNYSLTFEPKTWILLCLLAIVLVPIQTSTEELFFRGYVMQGLRLLTRNRFVIIVLVSLLFAVPHFGNPEMARGPFVWGALGYFSWGAFATAIAIKDNGLELSLGVHAANNLFLTLFLSTPDSVVVTPAIFTYDSSSLDPRLGLVSTIIDAVLFYAIFFGGISRPATQSEASKTPTSD